nr:two-component system response regulator [Alphaproteobacteria bacterium]
MTGDGAGGAEGIRSLLLVDDDEIWLQRLAMAMERRGFAVATASSVKDGVGKAREHAPAYAVIDLR